MNEETTTEKLKQLFLHKKILIRKKVGERDFFYRGECFEITETQVIILDIKQGAMSFPFKEISIEVIQ